MSQERLIALLDDLRRLPAETEWVEFKVDNTDVEQMAKRVSALSNGARLRDQVAGYFVWGIEDGSHNVVGTKFKGAATKAKQQPLPLWLSRVLDPAPAIEFHEVNHPDGRVVLMTITPAVRTPTRFNGTAFIRVGEATPRLSDHPALEEILWRKLQTYAWESDIALEFVAGSDVLALLDHGAFFSLTNAAPLSAAEDVLERLSAENLISADVGGRWNILNLGAILFAKKLSSFPRLTNRAIRLIQYQATSRVKARQEYSVESGYAIAFEPLIDQVIDLTTVEDIGGSLRLRTSLFPRNAVRELIANAMVHQDMTVTGARPMVEIFSNRLEITNPGEPLVDIKRILDSPPKSRNERLAALMRRMDMCEERGTGIDRIVEAIEDGNLPPLSHAIISGSTRAVLHAPRPFSELSPSEKSMACFQHAALQFENGRRATNASLRVRFGVPKTNSAAISRVIVAAKKARLVKPADPAAPNAGVVPFYA